MNTNNTDTGKDALLWWNGLDERQKIGAIATEFKITFNKARELWDYWQGGLTDAKIKEIYTTCNALANPSPTAAIEGVKEDGGKLSYTVKNTGSLGIDIFEEGNTHPIFFTASNHPKSIANAERIVMAVNGWDEMVKENEILKEALQKIDAATYAHKEWTEMHRVNHIAKEALKQINNL